VLTASRIWSIVDGDVILVADRILAVVVVYVVICVVIVTVDHAIYVVNSCCNRCVVIMIDYDCVSYTVVIINCVTTIVVGHCAVVYVVIVVVIVVVICVVVVVVYENVIIVAYVFVGCIVHGIFVRTVVCINGFADGWIVWCTHCHCC